MIKIHKLSYGFPAKDLYNDISFTIERGQHCALIGSNGTGKSTLVDMIMDPDEYLYDGKIIKADECRIGYASQFSVHDKSQKCTVFEYLSRRFVELQNEITSVCEEMATADPEEIDSVFEKYQELLDRNEAMDGDNYESNIRKQLYVGKMTDVEQTGISQLSGGEYKLLQIIREMLLSPNLLILDEPDVFLDFGNLSSLTQMINNYKGTLLVITHNRYLLNHCFNKILHLENGELQEFDGNYTEYRCSILREKLKLRIQNLEEQAEIARTEEMVDILRTRATLMANPVIGRSVNAKQTQLDRLLARQIKAPFIEIREPQITLPEICREAEAAEEHEAGDEPKAVLTVENYQVEFDEDLLQIALMSCSGAEFLILDEPTSHLDIYGQQALERAIEEYKGTVLMVNHDFYLVANCADYVLLAEDNTVRRVRGRNFRKMVYDRYFDSGYLEIDRKKQELETGITAAFKKDDLAAVDKLCTELELISGQQ